MQLVRKAIGPTLTSLIIDRSDDSLLLSKAIQPALVAADMLPHPRFVSRTTWHEQIRRFTLFQRDWIVQHPDGLTPVRDSVTLTDPKLIRLFGSEVTRIVLFHHLFQHNRRTSDLAAQILWPPRAKKDVSIRRNRLFDFLSYHKRTKAWLPDLSSFSASWDVITITNLCAFSLVLGKTWFDQLDRCHFFSLDPTYFVTVSKMLSDTIKTTGLDDPDWAMYVENSTMTGYRNPPFPGFDVFKEAESLADGGLIHNYVGRSWPEVCRKYLPMSIRPVEYVSYQDYVTSAAWLTSGSSSVGRLSAVDIDGNELSFKARKNMVPDVLDLHQLWEDSLSTSKQTCTTLIKSELGKIRLAVAGDMYTYLKMSWVNYLLGGAYHDWPGDTTEETISAQTDRLKDMLSATLTHYGLPFDFQAFDHQPLTTELVTISDLICEHARHSVPSNGIAEFDSITSQIRDGFSDSVMTAKDADQVKEFSVSGGLMSGLRWTSLVGNAWNTVMTGLACEIAEGWGYDMQNIKRYIRGDDSAIYTQTWEQAAAIHLAYVIVGVKGGKGKFSIQTNAMEFLRVWFQGKCVGYPARAIPGLTQRKPWTDDAWSPVQIVSVLADVTATLFRRLPGRTSHIKHLWSHLASTWARLHFLPFRALQSPKALGGLGLIPPPPGLLISTVPPIPTVSKSRLLKSAVTTPFTRNSLVDHFATEYGVDVSQHADGWALEELEGKLASGVFPKLLKTIRERWLWELKSNRRSCHSRLILLPDVSDLGFDDLWSQPYEETIIREKQRAAGFATRPYLPSKIQDYRRLFASGLERRSLQQWLLSVDQQAYLDIKGFHKSWHIAERIDYLSGTIPTTTSVLHPALASRLSWAVASILNPSTAMVRGLSTIYASVIEPVLHNSLWSQMLYQW